MRGRLLSVRTGASARKPDLFGNVRDICKVRLSELAQSRRFSFPLKPACFNSP